MSTDHSGDDRFGSAQRRPFPPKEVARRGDAIYDRSIRALVEPAHEGEVVAIDIETGAFALGPDALTAARRLRVLQPDAEVWLVRVGSRALHRIGASAGPSCL
jgi:hypothetical protein